MKALKCLFSYFKPYISVIVLYLFMGVLIALLSMLVPQFTKHIINLIISDGTSFSFWLWSADNKASVFLYIAFSWLGVILIKQLLSVVRNYIMTYYSTQAVCKLRQDAFSKLLWQSQSFLQQDSTGNILTVINGDSETVKMFFTGTIPVIIESLFSFIFASIMIWQMNPVLVFVAYAFALPLLFVSKKISRVFAEHYHLVRDASAALSTITQENISGIRIVKAYAQENAEIKKFTKKNEAFRDRSVNYMKIWAKNYIPVGIISILPNVFITAISAIFVINGNLNPSSTNALTLAEFVALSGYLTFILTPFEQANNWINAIQRSVTSGNKLFTFLHTNSIISTKKNAKKIDTNSVNISVKNVSLKIRNNQILKDISFELPQGKTLGIVGTTGSGKSMLINILMRFFDVTKGSVSINGTDVRDLDLTSLRSCFSTVFQDVFLFSDTIAKNIAYGKCDATIADVKKCAKTACASEFIEKLPDEYDTIIGERGMGLSGGQKQRISIARALLNNSPVLIFDDATSALDMQTEEALYSSLKTDFSHNSKIIIAHRISSVKACDEILVLKNGEIIERGTHDELVSLKGHYFDIYKEQYSTVLNSI